jgi:enamine deaminase RidA (YjgF/YER057c/UK114 family)
MSAIAQQLSKLGITLSTPGTPAAAYVMAVTSGNQVFLSGHIDTARGKAAARSIAIDLLSTLNAHLGSLDRVKRIVKLMGLVNSTAEFTEHHLVVNGCSELLGEIFGDAGKHARSAFGVAQIPLGACVEIEMIVEI